jgi:U3 small nucleolar RNA-associated protein 21
VTTQLNTPSSIITMAKTRKQRKSGGATKKVAKKSEDKLQQEMETEQSSPPQQVSSSSDSESHEEEDVMSIESSSSKDQKASQGFSRIFSPYRTLGIVSHGPFHLLPNQNSSSAMVCGAIGERFHMMQCDRLHPVLVSQAVPPGQGETGPQTIAHIVSDNSLSLSLVAHGPKAAPRHVTLFQRTQPIGTITVCESKNWTVVDLLHLGKIKVTMTGEKEGKKENAVLCAAILSKGKPLPDDGIPVVGDGNESDSDNDDSDSDADNDDDDTCRGQVVLLVSSRSTLTVLKRIEFKTFDSFCPRVAIHPPTYVNKIIIGGSCFKTSKDAMVLINVKSGKIIHSFKCLAEQEGKSEITTLEQSPAIDTIAVGTSTGMVHLINTRYDKLLFSLRHKSRDGSPTRITSLSFRTDGSALQYGIAPMAVGRSDGTISIWDLTPSDDEDGNSLGRTLLCEMERAHYPGGVHKLQYMPQEPLLVSTGTDSNSIVMHIFDNPDHSGRILRQRNGHTSSPKHIRYLHPGAGAGGGILVNAADGTDASACQILSSGGADRTLRIFSTVRSVLDKEYSQGRGLEKQARKLGLASKTELLLPPVTALASSETRSRDWGDLVTIHKDHAFAYVWSSKQGSQSGPVLRQNGWNVSAMKAPPPLSAEATAVALSTCGNFALVETKGGTIYKYNVQSGNPRGSYPVVDSSQKSGGKRRVAGDIRRTFQELEKTMKLSNRASNIDKEEQDLVEQARRRKQREAKLLVASHAGFAVKGIAVDAVNKTVISVGEDAKLILWNFKTHAPHKKSPYKLPAAATKLCHVRDSDLAAIALEDYSALLFDCSSLSIVRRFGFGNKSVCHNAPISDIGFSPDGRTLYTSSLDSTIRVWDVPTNSCVDWLGFNTPPTSLTVSPTGEFLATTHAGKLGISLWSDRSFYQTVHVDGSASLTVPARMDDPAPLAETESSEEDRDNVLKRLLSPATVAGETQAEDDEDEDKGPVTAKVKGLITLSGLPPAHWKNLFHLELVKQRNKPTEAPKKPPTAPFFLQWRPRLNTDGEAQLKPETTRKESQSDGDDEWDAVWSDDDEGNQGGTVTESRSTNGLPKRDREEDDSSAALTKKRKVTHYRSHLAALLEQCANRKSIDNNQFKAVTDHIATLGPSAIDVSLSTLCSGMHDLDEGIPLLILACRWLLEACQSRERFEAINAYLHRFLYLHSNILAGIDDSPSLNDELQEIPDEETKQQEQRQQKELLACIELLRQAQREASEALQNKMKNTMCLLRHFSRMV